VKEFKIVFLKNSQIKLFSLVTLIHIIIFLSLSIDFFSGAPVYIILLIAFLSSFLGLIYFYFNGLTRRYNSEYKEVEYDFTDSIAALMWFSYLSLNSILFLGRHHYHTHTFDNLIIFVNSAIIPSTLGLTAYSISKKLGRENIYAYFQKLQKNVYENWLHIVSRLNEYVKSLPWLSRLSSGK